MKKNLFFIISLLFLALNLHFKSLAFSQVVFAENLEDFFDEDFDFFSEEESVDAQIEDEPYSGKVYMRGLFLDEDVIKISVISEDVTVPVVGIAFHLKYEKAKLHFLKYEPGEFLEDGGDPVYLVQNDQKKGELVFGETLRRNDRFPIGGKIVSEVYFQIIDQTLWENSDVVKFEFGNGVLSTLDTVRQDIQNIEWENLHLDEDGVNHWQEKPPTTATKSTQANSLMANFFADGNFWKWLFFASIIFFIFRKFLLSKLLKNKDKKRHTVSVNFK